MLDSSCSNMVELTEQELQHLYAWIDEIPLSRQKKNISRDFSDGVMAAEIVHYFFPRIIEIHNYPAANSTTQKLDNWRLLNRKVFTKLDFNVPDELLQSVVSCKQGIIEYILNHLKTKIESLHKSNEGVCPPFSHITTETDPLSMTTAGNTVSHHEMQRHMILSPSSQHQMSMTQLNKHSSSTHLPPLVKSPAGVSMHTMTHLSKPHKPSNIPRPIHSGNSNTSRHALPPINNSSHIGQSNGGVAKGMSYTKLPAIKEGLKVNKGIKVTKKDSNYSSSRHGSQVTHQHRGKKDPTDSQPNGMIIMAEKDQVIMELQETVQLLQMKVNRLEHLVRIKDYKIQELDKLVHKTSSTSKGQTMR